MQAAEPATEPIFDGRSLGIPAEKLLELVDQTQVTPEFKENYLQLDSLDKIERLVSFNEDKLNGAQYLLLLRSLIAKWHDLNSVRPDEHGYGEARDQIKQFNAKIQQLEATMIKNCLHYKASYGPFETNLFIQLVGGSRITIDKTKSIPQQDLKDLEKQILLSLNDYMKTNFLHTVAAFLRINYIPRDVIAEMMRQNKFMAFQAEGTYKLLSQIITSRLQSLDLILDKLWLRLDETH